MISIRFYLDRRDVAPGSPAPLKLVLTRNGVRALIPLRISLLPSQWDARRQAVVGHPDRQTFNNALLRWRLDAEEALRRLGAEGRLSGLRACEVRRLVAAELLPEDAPAPARPALLPRLLAYMDTRSPGTRRLYAATLARLRCYLGDALGSLALEEVDAEWLRGFDAFLSQTSPSVNARNIHLRNLRAVFNDAIADGVTAAYPFRKFKVRPEPTRKRNFKVDTLRAIFAAEGLEPWERRYMDFLKLTFMLIGINVVDLCRLREVRDGRVEYVRAKTHRAYSVKVEPEAMAIIERYRGKGQLLEYLDTNGNYRSFYASLVRGLRSIRDKLQGRGLEVGELTTYWMRHSWATLAAGLDVPRDTIAAALGHGGNTVTDIYIERDPRKVDEANRRVLDWVLYGRR